MVAGTKLVCQSCESTEVNVFYEVKGVPAHSVLLMPTREEARAYPNGDLVLGFCRRCGFIGNVAFDSSLLDYSPRYEETQGFSPTFNAFAQRLATLLVSRFNLRNKTIIEIGCGKGEFLAALCALGDNRGIGFDPGYVDGRTSVKLPHNIVFVKDFYSEKYADYSADFMCCRMTLEHIDNVEEFIRTIRNAVRGRRSTVVFIQVPNVTHILRDLAFWDIYYEHCSYFGGGALSDLFQRCGFDVIDLWQDYNDQYLMLAAIPTETTNQRLSSHPDYRQQLADDVAYFEHNYRKMIVTWQNLMREFSSDGQRTVIWGAGSKGVAFLTTLGIEDEVQYVVDINPHRQGTYMAGTGHQIVPPVFLTDYAPHNVIVMNPVYRDEIQESLNRMGLQPRLFSLGR